MMIHKKMMMTAKKMKMYINHNDSALVGAPHRAAKHQHPAYDHDYDYDLLMINHIMITMIFWKYLDQVRLIWPVGEPRLQIERRCSRQQPSCAGVSFFLQI